MHNFEFDNNGDVYNDGNYSECLGEQSLREYIKTCDKICTPARSNKGGKFGGKKIIENNRNFSTTTQIRAADKRRGRLNSKLRQY